MQKTILFCGFVILNLFLISNVHSEEFVKTTESKDIISDSDLEAEKFKAQYQKRIISAWNAPKNSAGTEVLVKVKLDDSGQIKEIFMDETTDQTFRVSIVNAIKTASPFTLPSDKIVREKAKNLSINFSSIESFPEVSKPFRIITNELSWSRPPKIIFNKNDLEGQDRSILVSVIANEQGKITEAKILRSSGLSKLDTKALNAAKAAKFKPFYVGGKYHTINVVLPFQFHYE